MQNTKNIAFFTDVPIGLSAGCSDTENVTDIVDTSKKRGHRCHNISDEFNNTSKTPTKNVEISTTTPSPSKSPFQKKLRYSKETPVKNLFKEHTTDLNKFNIDILERLVNLELCVV